ncbi:MAG: TatD family hydrolase [Candidatus Krumholzibacteriia bacterium]
MTQSCVPDVHCHLDALEDAEQAVEEALEAGVRPICAVGTEQVSSERALELRQKYPGDVLAAVGLHPSEIANVEDSELRAELEFVERALETADALGEVGLDYRDASDEAQRARQREALDRQLRWAECWRKPVNMHCRRAEHDVLDVAAEFAQRTGLGVNLHWFTHSEKLARRCAESGVYISPGPSILHSEPQAKVAGFIATQLLLLETDSPTPYGGERARPAWARRVAERLAEIRGQSLEGLADILQDNFRRYLGRTSPPGAPAGA